MAEVAGKTIGPELIATASPSFWLHSMQPRIRIDGTPLSFKDYPYIPGIIDDDHPDQVTIKGAQLGLTIAEILRKISRMARVHLRGALYLFPTDRDVTDFSKARFTRILRENPPLATIVQDTDSTTIKNINGTFTYFRGAGSVSGLKSIPIDDLTFDERDEMNLEMVLLANHRLDGAIDDPEDPLWPLYHGIRTEFSTPTIPGYGVDASYQESDQMAWHIKCQNVSCGAWTCLENTWPDCIRKDKDGKWIRVCRKCGGPIHPVFGQWVPKYPERDKRGRWISQLSSPRRDPARIIAKWEHYKRIGKLKEFYRSVLGIAYAEIDEALALAALIAASNAEYVRVPSSDGPTAMGADVGKKDFHWVVGERISETQDQVINYGVCRTVDEFIQVMDRYKVECLVIDEGAEARAVEEIKKRRYGQTYGGFYADTKKGTHDWNEKKRIVTINRTESLDYSHHTLISGFSKLPKLDDRAHGEFFPQMMNLVRQIREKKDTKEEIPIWTPRGQKNDHYRHAYNYYQLALTRVATAARVREIRSRHGRRRRRKGRTWMSN